MIAGKKLGHMSGLTDRNGQTKNQKTSLANRN